MKIRSLIAVSAVAAAGVIGGISHPASAGCGVTITADNDENVDVTVNSSLSKVRTSTVVLGQRVAGPWKSIGSYSTNIDAGAMVDRAFTLDLACNIDRQYKLYADDGTSTWYEYHNEVGPGGSWTRDITPFIDLEH